MRRGHGGSPSNFLFKIVQSLVVLEYPYIPTGNRLSGVVCGLNEENPRLGTVT